MQLNFIQFIVRPACVAMTYLVFIATAHPQSIFDSLEQELNGLNPQSKNHLILSTKLAKEYAETDADTAIVICNQLLTLCDHLKVDSLKGQVYIGLSTAYGYLAKYDTSTWYSYRAIDIADNYNDTITLIDAYNNIGINFMYQEEDEKAIEYYKRVESLSRAFGDSLRLGHALNNIGIIHGYAEEADQELAYYQLAAEIFKEINELEGLGNTYLNSGTTYSSMKQFQRADENFAKALEIFRQLDFSSGIQNVILSMAENELGRGNYRKAEQLALDALDIAQENQLTQDIIFTYTLLEEISLSSNNYKKAHDFLSKGNSLKDGVFTLEKNRQINELETRYETARKEAEIEQLALANELKDVRLSKARFAQFATAIGGGMVIVLLVVFFTLRHKKQKAEKEAHELQLEALKERFIELHTSPANIAVNLDLSELNGKLHNPLTEREFDTLRLTLEGKSNPEISDQLFISVNTVKYHLKNTYSKLGVNNRKEAFQYMLQVDQG
ncbi:MAG: LuxR C-terminal-related transcriptional regulator [Cyclobacteriaceae bacterium]